MANVNLLLIGATSYLGCRIVGEWGKDRQYASKWELACDSRSGYKVKAFAIVRKPQTEEKVKIIEWLKSKSVVVIEYDPSTSSLKEQLETFFFNSRSVSTLWMSSHSDLDAMNLCSEKSFQMLTIGSVALLDWANGRMSMNPYVETKAKHLLIEGARVTTICPGFFVEDTPLNLEDYPVELQGLHTDTTQKLTAEEFDESYDWGKQKQVTVVDSLLREITIWICGYAPVKRFYLYCTNVAYPRWKLREFLTGKKNTPQAIKERNPSFSRHADPGRHPSRLKQ